MEVTPDKTQDGVLPSEAEERLQELESTIEAGLKTFVEVGNALREIRDSRLYKENGYSNFEDYCRQKWGWSRRNADRHIEAAGTAEILRPIGLTLENEYQARQLAPLAKDEEQMVELFREAKEEFGDFVTPQRIVKLANKRFERIKREDEARERTENQPPTTECAVERITVLHFDFRDLDDFLSENSVKLIFTDPPYPSEYLPLWRDLSHLAASCLTSDGMLAAYSGQFHLPKVMDLLSEELDYVWCGGLFTPGQHNQVQAVKVRSAMKPLLFYRRPDGPSDCHWMDDAFTSEGRKKEHHSWEQSIGAAKYYIEKLTKPGDLVVDPFAGSGTTAVACKELGRAFIGCDIDPSAVSTAIKRLEDHAA